MPAQAYPFNFDKQFEKYVKQFLRIFSGIQVQDGVDRDGDGQNKLRQVPVYYGTPERIVSSVLTKRRSFTNPTVPILAGAIESFELDEERKGPTKYHRESVTYKDSAGNYKQTQRMIGPPMTLNLSLSIYASSNDEMFQLLEQILLIFNPKVTIQKSEDIIDQNYLSQVELVSIDPEFNQPLSTEEKIMITTLQFRTNVRLNYPHVTYDNELIEKIVTNIFDETIETVQIENLETTDT